MRNPTLTPIETATLTPTMAATETPPATATALPTETPAPTIPPTPVACDHHGDINADGMVTPGDAQSAFMFYIDCAGMVPTVEQYCAADFCGAGGIAPCDGSVTPGDAQGILRAYLGFADPCGKGAEHI